VSRLFAEAGLTPLGEAGTYFQNIEFFETRLIPESAAMTLHAGGRTTELSFPDDFIRSGGYGEAVESITAPLVFAGYGITAPEYDHDDYADVEVDGKILVLLSGAPAHFATDQRAYYSSGRTKTALAAAQGAVGIVTVRTPVDQARRPWQRYLSGIGRPGMRWLDARGRPHAAHPQLQGSAALSETGAAKLFTLAGLNLDEIFTNHASGGTGSFGLEVDASVSRSSTQRTVGSANVLGLVPGSDPVLRDEYVVYSAHLDHIGIRPGIDGDDIHNGAYDNAAGIGIIVEIARSMMQLPPRRSVIFAAVTAEEKGLQGSSYLAKNPPVPVASLVANINIDMPFLGFPVKDVEAFGAEHSSLLAAVTQATRELRMGLTPDPMPEEVRFVRSDQFSFVKEGIPALAFKAGSQSSDPAIDGKAMLSDFLKNHYHRPSDDLSLPYSPEGAERFARAAARLGFIVANADERPAWNPGDFFGERFAVNAD
jgi:Zn-dependent M28 family amino/carboxypeptidase